MKDKIPKYCKRCKNLFNLTGQCVEYEKSAKKALSQCLVDKRKGEKNER